MWVGGKVSSWELLYGTMFGYEVGFQKGCGPNIYTYEGIVTYSEDLSAAFMLEKHKHIGFVSKKESN